MNKDMLLRYKNIVGVDHKNKIVMVVGDIPYTISDEYDVIRLKQYPRILTIDRRKKYRPLIGGISIGHIQITAGTLGTIAYYNDEKVLVSNAHVFHPKPWEKELPFNRTIIQPGSYDGGDYLDKVGIILKHVKINLVNEESNCPIAKIWSEIYNVSARIFGRKTRLMPIVTERNKVDVAIAKPLVEYEDYILCDDGKKIDPPNIIGLLFAGSDVDNIYIVSKAVNIEKELGIKFTRKTLNSFKYGEHVMKCGRTTGCGEGYIISDNMVMRVFYGVGFAEFEDVVVVKGKVAGGDSGSMVWKT